MTNETEQAVLQLNQRVIALFNAGQYQDAIDLAGQAVSLSSRLGKKHPGYATSLNNLASLYQSLGDYQKAESYAREVKEIRRQVLGEKHPVYAITLTNLAVLYQSMGDYQQAEPLYRQAHEIRRQVLGEEHPDYAKSLHNLAGLYLSLGDYQQAEPLYRQAQEIRRQVLGEKHPEYAASLHSLAALYDSMGEYQKAELYYHEAMEIYRAVLGEKHPSYATTLTCLAGLYESMGDYKQAEHYYHEAMEIYRAVFGERHDSYATILDGLASLYQSMGDYQQAEPLYRQAREIRRQVLGENHPVYATTLSNLAGLYRLIGEYQQAEPLLRQAKEIYREILGEKNPGYATSLNNLAVLYDSMGEYQKAELYYRQAQEIRRQVLGEKHPDYAQSLHGLAVLYDSSAEYQKAEPYYREALEIYREALGEKHSDYAKILNALAVCLAATDRHTEVLELTKRIADIHNTLIGQIFSMGSERQRTSFLKTIEPEFFSLLSLLCYAIPQSIDSTQTALEIILRRKAIRAEALMAQRDSVLGGSYPHLAPKLRELSKWREQIAMKTLAGPGQASLAVHNQALAEWERQKEVLEVELARQIPEINLEQKLRRIDRAVVAMALPEGSALVEFVRFDVFDFKAVRARRESQWKPAHYLAFILPAGKPDDLEMIDLGEAEGIDRMIATFRSAVTGEQDGRGTRDLGNVPHEADGDLFVEPGRKLRAILFDRLLNALDGCKRLFIAPDGDLTQLPFEVLPMDDGRYLIDEYKISYLSVGRDVVRFKFTSNRQPSRSLIVADPDFDLDAKAMSAEAAATADHRSGDLRDEMEKVGRLPGTRVEGKNVAVMLDAELWLEEDALDARLKQCQSPRILHFATHGFFLKTKERDLNKVQGLGAIGFGESGMEQLADSHLENPLLCSGLLLAGYNTWRETGRFLEEAEDGRLFAEDVTGLDLLDTELVVLSACDTGRGEVHVGEGVFGLRRAFVLAGAKTLVMSLWKVPDKQTQELMEVFYQRILNGQSRSEALREAQLKIKQRYPHPRYWGAFILQGEPHQLRDSAR